MLLNRAIVYFSGYRQSKYKFQNIIDNFNCWLDNKNNFNLDYNVIAFQLFHVANKKKFKTRLL